MATAIEYGLIAGLISVAAITAFTTTGTNQTPQYKWPDTVRVERFYPAHKQPTDTDRKAFCLDPKYSGMSLNDEIKAVRKTATIRPEAKGYVVDGVERGNGTAYNGCVERTYLVIYKKESWLDRLLDW